MAKSSNGWRKSQANSTDTSGVNNASCHRQTLAGKIGTAEESARRTNHPRRDGRSALRRRVRVGGLRRNQCKGLERESLPAGHSRPSRDALQEARIHPVNEETN